MADKKTKESPSLIPPRKRKKLMEQRIEDEPEFIPLTKSNEGTATLADLSYPPTEDELKALPAVSYASLPDKYTRDPKQRVYVNRDIRLDKIKWFGFDMDYTLAVYKSPEYEGLTYQLATEQLIKTGYPEAIRDLKYDPTYALRGLFLDKELGNFLKIDSFGYIGLAVHGRKKLKKEVVDELYPSHQVHGDAIGKRFHMLDTLFTVPESCLYANLVEFFETSSSIGSEGQEKGWVVHTTDMDLSFKNLFLDVREAVDSIHKCGTLKEKTLDDIDRYVEASPGLAQLLVNAHAHNIGTFLLTNSGYAYTDKIMDFLLGDHLRANPSKKSWREYFKIIIVDSKKPSFFRAGTTLRKVNLDTGTLQIGSVHKTFVPHHVYSGGNLSLFENLVGATGDQILYFGDHIFSDIIVAKKKHGWRNLLVVRELNHEIDAWVRSQPAYNRLRHLEFIKAEVYRGLDFNTVEPPDVSVLQEQIRESICKFNDTFNPYFGSLFRSGTKQSFFAMQVERYSDLYTYNFANIANYPLFYHFTTASPNYMPHEISTGAST
eukprot:TRINITY_DN6481_c0_g1_i1.p1 TRINITY_DN6481_c0_g1~~TRINITY_DN6481_c0_g1_i1.p1  ORF type:complete len:546 (+),score=146.10 TRINITY_DN6481_c0_g1_i1:184-1821(+)